MIGELFRCVCCGDERNQEEASLDRELGGPVCEECRMNVVKAREYLCIHANVDRPINIKDINPHNFSRFSNYNSPK